MTLQRLNKLHSLQVPATFNTSDVGFVVLANGGSVVVLNGGFVVVLNGGFVVEASRLGQRLRKHLLLLLDRPLQSLGSPRQVLVLICTPLPQVTLQALNLPHALQIPPTIDIVVVGFNGGFVVEAKGHDSSIMHHRDCIAGPLHFSFPRQILFLFLRPQPHVALQALKLLHSLQVPPTLNESDGRSGQGLSKHLLLILDAPMQILESLRQVLVLF